MQPISCIIMHGYILVLQWIKISKVGVSRSRSVPKNGNARWVPVPRNGNAKRVRVLRNGNAGWVPVPKNGERITTLYKMTKICISIPIYTYELQENAI